MDTSEPLFPQRPSKVRGTDLPPVFLLTRFILNVTHSFFTHQPPDSLSQWPGVVLNAHQEVIEINWSSRGMLGTLSWAYLPCTLINLNLGNGFLGGGKSNQLFGDVELSLLPHSLQLFNLFRNSFSGELSLSHLPPGLIEFTASSNAFTGSICLLHLPRTLELLFLKDNHLCGSLDLGSLPPALKNISLSRNRFHGEIRLDGLPVHLHTLSLHGNQLCGSLDLTRLPASLRTLHLSSNRFAGHLQLPTGCDNEGKFFNFRQNMFDSYSPRPAPSYVLMWP